MFKRKKDYLKEINDLTAENQKLQKLNCKMGDEIAELKRQLNYANEECERFKDKFSQEVELHQKGCTKNENCKSCRYMFDGVCRYGSCDHYEKSPIAEIAQIMPSPIAAPNPPYSPYWNTCNWR